MSELYDYERALANGSAPFCGVDEAGRGPLAGPVFAAAVVLGDVTPDGLRDSKKLSPANRDRLFGEITARAAAWAIASASVAEIDELNILGASLLAMRRAVETLSVKPALLLVDGNITRGLPQPAIAVVGGDDKCASIAAASVLAKVARDRYMTELHARFPMYGFDRHKGYPTKAHRAAVLLHGPCEEHRRSFAVKP